MRGNCRLVCCPACGYETVDIQNSGLARLVQRWLTRQSPAAVSLTLADAPVGHLVRVVGFRPGLSAHRQARLQAYGLVAGYWVRVLQHSPVLVVEIEHTELALEGELADQVWVEASAR